MNSSEKIVPRVLGAVFATISFIAPAFGSHNSWVLDDLGQNCVPYGLAENPDPLGYQFGVRIRPKNSLATSVFCPVNLSGQFDGTTGNQQAIFHHATVPVLEASIDFIDGSGSDRVWCEAHAVTATGSLYVSRRVGSGTGNSFFGAGTLFMAKTGQSPHGWAGTLDGVKTTAAIRSFGYKCDLPAFSGHGVSGITAYHTSICQNNTQCVGS